MRDWGLAQLGEHLLCKQGVVGSNPVASQAAWRRAGHGAGTGMVEIHRRSAGAISVLRFCRGAGLAWPRVRRTSKTAVWRWRPARGVAAGRIVL